MHKILYSEGIHRRKEFIIMSWLFSAITFLAGYIVFLLRTVCHMWRMKKKSHKLCIIVRFKGGADIVEAVLWDLFRLQSWDNYDFDLLVIDGCFNKEVSLILKILHRKYHFVLVKLTSCPASWFGGRDGYLGIRLLEVTGEESLRVIRRKLIAILNESDKRNCCYKRSS
jgi:hypothetical protein